MAPLIAWTKPVQSFYDALNAALADTDTEISVASDWLPGYRFTSAWQFLARRRGFECGFLLLDLPIGRYARIDDIARAYAKALDYSLRAALAPYVRCGVCDQRRQLRPFEERESWVRVGVCRTCYIEMLTAERHGPYPSLHDLLILNDLLDGANTTAA